MPIDLYHVPRSPPCFAVRLTAAAIKIDLNLKNCEILKGYNMTPEFIKMNPQHTIPTINDNGFSLWESRAIMIYLVTQYGKNDSLYPKDNKKRAVVDQRLYFDMGLYQSICDYYGPIIFQNASQDQTKYVKMCKSFEFLENFLEGENYVAGKNLTLADLALVSTLSTCETLGYDFSSFKNVSQWYQRIKKEAPKFEEINAEFIQAFEEFVASLKK